MDFAGFAEDIRKNGWQLYGVSFWTQADGEKLALLALLLHALQRLISDLLQFVHVFFLAFDKTFPGLIRDLLEVRQIRRLLNLIAAVLGGEAFLFLL